MQFRFTRSIIPEMGKLKDATEFAAEVTDYLNENTDISLSWGVQQFGEGRIVWTADYASMADIQATLEATLADQEYGKIIAGAQGLFVNGTLQDTVVALM